MILFLHGHIYPARIMAVGAMMLDPEAVCNKLTRPFEYPVIFVSLEGQRTGRGEEALSVPRTFAW